MFKVEGLTKKYDGFTLDGVTFSIPRGYIVGFIGANGAGKSTTLKSMLGIIKADSGKVEMGEFTLERNEDELKRRVSLSLGSFDYYAYEKASKIARATASFYDNWDWEKYEYYMKKFSLDENKKIRDFSAGMRVKFSITLALSHDAELFVFDEPTSGLDPVAREEVLDVFREIVEDGQRSIIYSTHITSDLDKCADYILLIDGGRLLLFDTVESVLSSHLLVHGGEGDEIPQNAIGVKKNRYSFTALVKGESALKSERPNLEDIMVYYSRKRKEAEYEN